MGFFGDLFNSEEKQEKKAKLSRIKLLLMLSNVDGEISAVERGFIFAAADILGFNNQDVLKVTKELMNGDGGVYIPKDSDKAFDLLRDLVKLMLIDGEMHPNEIHFFFVYLLHIELLFHHLNQFYSPLT